MYSLSKHLPSSPGFPHCEKAKVAEATPSCLLCLRRAGELLPIPGPGPAQDLPRRERQTSGHSCRDRVIEKAPLARVVVEDVEWAHRTGPPESDPWASRRRKGGLAGWWLSRWGEKKRKVGVPAERLQDGQTLRMGAPPSKNVRHRRHKRSRRKGESMAYPSPNAIALTVCCTLSYDEKGFALRSYHSTKLSKKDREEMHVPLYQCTYIPCGKGGVCHLTTCRLRASTKPRETCEDAALERADLGSLLGNRHPGLQHLIQPRIRFLHITLARQALCPFCCQFRVFGTIYAETFHRLRHSTAPAKSRPSRCLTTSFERLSRLHFAAFTFALIPDIIKSPHT